METIFNLLTDVLGFSGNKHFAVLLGAIFLVLGFFCLVKGSDWFVDGAVGIAERFGIPHMVIGLTIVAMGTSAPEAAVSITGASTGAADTAVGNIIGSNILNILIILGISAVVCPLVVDKATVTVDAPVMIFATALLLILGLDGSISFVDAAVLFVIFVAYMVYLFVSAAGNRTDEDNAVIKRKPIWVTVVITVVGLAIVIIGSQLAVTGATSIARAANIKESFIGLTIVALGTSLPELFTSVAAAKKGNADIAIGNIVGSNIFNILFVLGISGLITPILFAPSFLIDTAVAIGAALILLLCCVTKRRVSRFEGALMIAGYAVYFVYLLMNI